MLVATEDGVFLWPGIALVERRGNGFVAMEPRKVSSAIGGAFWLAPYVNAYLDKPKSLEELQAAVNTPRGGTDVHHIVEQRSARNDKFPESQIQDSSNLVRIPTLKHWELNAWFEEPNDDYEGQTPRQYVKGKDWETRTRVGLAGLKAVGVLMK